MCHLTFNFVFLFSGDRLLIGTGVGQLLVYDIKEPLGKDDTPYILYSSCKHIYSDAKLV